MMFTNTNLKKLIIPLIIEQVLIMMVGMVDTTMISHAGVAAISGVSLVDMIQNFILFVLASVATGGAVIISQYIGSKDQTSANMASSQLVGICFLLSIMIMMLCLLCYKPILQLLFGAVDSSVMDAASTYFVICTFSLPFLGIYNAGAAIFRSMNKTSEMMYISLGVNIVNFIADYIGVFVLHAGVAGVAIPTLLTRSLSGVVMLYLARNKRNLVHVQIKQICSWNRIMVNKILHVAIPNGIENGLFHLGKILVTSIVALFGTYQIAANGIANSIDQITPIVVNAMNLAIVTIVGQCIGANQYEQAKFYIRKLMKISYIATGILNIVVLLVLPFLFKLYSLSEDVLQLCITLVLMHNILALLLHPTAFLLPNAIRSSGDVKFTMYVGILSMLIFRLGSAYLFGIVYELGILGVWIAMGLDWLCRSIVFVWRYRSARWQTYRLV